MENIIVVDDEIRQCRGLRNILTKHYPEFEIFAFTDANEALEFMENNIVRIMITDIRMPGIDGLELTKLVKETYPVTKIILLTGYAEFEYARQAISLGAFDYLLKPLNVDKLYDAFERIKKELDMEKILFEEHQKVKEQLNVALPVYLEQQLNQWVYGCLSDEDKVEIEKIFPKNSRGTVIATHLDGLDALTASMSAVEIEEQKIELKWWLKKLLIPNSHSVSFFSHTITQTIITIVARGNNSSSHDPLFNQKMLSDEIESLYMDTNIYATMGIGKMSENLLNEIQMSFNSAVSVLDYRFYFGRGVVVDAAYILPKKVSLLGISLADEDYLKESIRAMDSNKAIAAVKNVFERFVANGYPEPEKLKSSMINFVCNVARFFSDVFKQSELDLFLSSLDLTCKLKPYYDDFEETLCDYVKQLVQQVILNKSGNGAELIDKFQAYLLSNYAHDISLDEISAIFHLTATYFSNLIKNLTGKSFSKHLITVRMNKAKELLVTSDLKIYEIASAVSYADVKYFNRVFKKETGITPIQYRTQITRENS